MFGINIRQNVQNVRNVQNFQESMKLEERAGSSSDVANIKEKPTTTRALWTPPEEKLLIQTWSENFNQLQTIEKDEAWARILSAVSKVGVKTLKQCKDKLRNMKELYKDAKDKNRQTGETFHKSPYFEEFDKVLGTRDVVVMPHLKQVGSNTTPTATAPTRTEVEALLKSGRKRKSATSTANKNEDLKKFLKDSEISHQNFMTNMLKEQLEAEKEQREKDRDLLRELFQRPDKNE